MEQVIEMTHAEKVEMYQKLEKDRLIEMLIAANDTISLLTDMRVSYIGYNNNSLLCQHKYIPTDAYWKRCRYCGDIVPLFHCQ